MQVRLALQALAQQRAEVLSHQETPWASVTFSGARHVLRLAFTGIDACEAGELFLAVLPEHEFAIPGHLVADAAIAEVTHSHSPESRMEIVLELLLLEAA